MDTTFHRNLYKTLNKSNPSYINDIFKLRNTDRLENNIS